MADPLLIVSPHLDDAVLSAGQLMAGRPDCVVVSVFAGYPPRPETLTSYDRTCGFTSAGEAIAARSAEDDDALAELGAVGVRLRFVDHQYREVELTGPPDTLAIAEVLARVCDERGIRMAMGPLGLAHPDHEVTAEAFRLLLTYRRQIEAWLYEDMPGRVLWPEQVAARLAWWADVGGLHPELGFAGTGDLATKVLAVRRYRSQLGALEAACGGNLYPVLVPERHHRLWRHDP